MSRETKGNIVEYGPQHGLYPVVTPEEVSEAFKQYLEICNALLISYDDRIVDADGVVRQESDYARIPQRKKNEQGQWITEYRDVPRKSAFRKLGRFYGVSTEIVDKERTVDPDTGAMTWHYTIRAWQGQVTTMGEAACSTDESSKQRTEHDAKATAHTRAKNRAISDLIGFGQVSAEEINYTPPENTNPLKKTEKKSPRVGPPPKQNPRKVEADAKVNPKIPGQAADKKQEKPDKRDQIAQALDKNRLNARDLDITEKDNVLTITPNPVMTPETWRKYQDIFNEHGATWNQQSWEVQV